MKKKLIEPKFWGSSENSEGSSSSEKILRILRKFWGWRSSENEDDDPQKILRILRKFWGWRSSENSEDEDPQKILSIRIFRKFWGWRSSENSEGPQKFLRMTILRKFWGFFRWQSPEISVNDNSNNHWIYPVFVSTTIVAKKNLQEQSQARSTALLCTQTTRSVFYLFCCFSLTIKAIFILK